jgi:hypothetical protein
LRQDLRGGVNSTPKPRQKAGRALSSLLIASLYWTVNSLYRDDEMAQLKRKRLCTYCGRPRKMTKDHGPPQGIFGEPLPLDLITVPACSECHAGTNNDDEYLKTAFATRKDTYESPDVQRVLPSVFRMFSNPDKAKFSRAFFAKSVMVNVFSPAGIYLGKEPAFIADLNRIRRVVCRTTIGLYFKETKTRLPPEYSAWSICDDEFARAPLREQQQIARFVNEIMVSPKRTIGGTVFSYRSHFAQDNPFYSVWLMTFYERITFLSATMPADKFKSPSPGATGFDRIPLPPATPG